MENKYFNLLDLIKFKSFNSDKSYISYVTGVEKFKDHEKNDIKALVDFIGVKDIFLYDDFLYSYTLPHLNKEFDLLKFGKNKVLSIELKYVNVGLKKIEKQLQTNKYYLKMISENIKLFTFVNKTKALYKLEKDSLLRATKEELIEELKNIKAHRIDVNKIFTPEKILVSPLNNPHRLINGEYLLTEDQRLKKRLIIDKILKGEKVFSVYGSSGTGKTLMLYDFAKVLRNQYKIAVVQDGKITDAHNVISKSLNIDIFDDDDKVDFKSDIYLIDNAEIIKTELLKKLLKEKIVIAFYDLELVLFDSSENENIKLIKAYSKNNSYRLTNKIRNNRKISQFIECLFSPKRYNDYFDFKESVSIIYENNQNNLMRRIEKNVEDDYIFINYNDLSLSNSLKEKALELDDLSGQEFDKVVIVLDGSYTYTKGKLRCRLDCEANHKHERKLLQALTKAKHKLIIYVNEPSVFERILKLL